MMVHLLYKSHYFFKNLPNFNKVQLNFKINYATDIFIPRKIFFKFLVEYSARDTYIKLQMVCNTWSHFRLPRKREAFLARKNLNNTTITRPSNKTEGKKGIKGDEVRTEKGTREMQDRNLWMCPISLGNIFRNFLFILAKDENARVEGTRSFETSK